MVNYEWLGDGGTNLASTNTCWSPTGVPTTGDVVIFNSKGGINNCNFDLTNASPTLTVDEIIIENDFNARVLLQTVPVIKGLFLNGYLEPSAASNIEFRHGASPNFFGSYKTYDSKFILIGDNANYNTGTITMSMYGSTLTKFDDGNHNETILNSGTFEPNYSTPTGTSGKTTFDALTINSGVTFAPTTTLTSNDRNKHFVIDNFTCNIDLFNGGEAIFQFKASSSGFNLPVRGASGYGSTPSATPTLFDSYFRKIILTADTAGHEVVMDDNTYIALEELEIGDGVMLKGPIGTGVQGSDIRLVNAPKVRGSWSFSEITSGIYRSPRTAEGPNAKVYGGFYITGKLTVDGLIDPTGMVFTPQVVNPESTNSQDTIWIDSETNHLFRGDYDTESIVHFNVRNDEGATIPLGAPLYSKGEIGGSNRIKVGIADASDMEEMNTTSTKDGHMILTGILNENITITGVVEQDIIYVAPHGGSAPYLTITRPTSGSHLVQNVGVCVRQSATNVSQGMKVAAIGRTNDIPNGVITTNSADADYVYIDDGGVFKKITPANLGIGGGGGSGTVTSIATTAPITGGTITTTGTIGISAATTSAAGSMSGADKTKLDGIATGATAYADADAIAAVEGEATLDLTGDVTIGDKKFTVDTDTLVVNAPSYLNRVGIGTATPSAELHIVGSANPTLRISEAGQSGYTTYTSVVDSQARIEAVNDTASEGVILDINPKCNASTGTSQEVRFFRDSRSGIDGNFRVKQVGTNTDVLTVYSDKDGTAHTMTMNGTIAQSVTSAVLVADGSGILSAASTLQDVAYLQGGQAETDTFTPTISAASWAVPPPATIQEAIERIANALAPLVGGTIP
jgi:hypothetical protein